jgi:2-polyprenyl-3-methyl-5-hydroxy-6-metoxy-1,4-benzoquinol methylase
LNEYDLYEKQYSEKKLINKLSFPFLRRLFSRFDTHREDVAVHLLNAGEKLLDIGSGNGSLIFKAYPKFKELYGIDISASRVKEAKISLEKEYSKFSNVYFSNCNVNQRINFPHNMFDAITCIAVIEHVFDPYFIVQEVLRLLKSGGIFVSQVPNIAYIRHRIHLFFGKLPVTSSPYNWKDIGWDGGHLHYFTQRTYCRFLEENGFSIIKVTGSGLFAKFRNFYPALLTGDICVKAKKC